MLSKIGEGVSDLQATEHMIEGSLVKINQAGPRPDYGCRTGDKLLRMKNPGQHIWARGKSARLYVGGIQQNISAYLVYSHFSRWGTVLDIYFPGMDDVERVNYCFVTFDQWQSALRACDESDRCIAGQLIRSISMADERMVSGTGSSRQEFWPCHPGARFQQDKGWLQQHGLPSQILWPELAHNNEGSRLQELLQYYVRPEHSQAHHRPCSHHHENHCTFSGATNLAPATLSEVDLPDLLYPAGTTQKDVDAMTLTLATIRQRDSSR